MTGMTGLLNAQMNLNMATKVQQAGEGAMSAGRILQREGVMSKNDDAVKAGEALQAEGVDKKNSSLGHLGKALDDIRASAKETAQEAKAKAKEDKEEAAKADEAPKTGEAATATVAAEKDSQIISGIEYIATESIDSIPYIKSPAGNNLDVKS